MGDSRRSGISDFRYVPLVACVLLVVLRLSIGWQFLYEGLWKIDTLDTPRPWSAEGYLENAAGPFRDVFREWLAEDPNDFRWLNQKWVAARWDRWAKRFTQHYNLTEEQQRRLHDMLEGDEQFRAVLNQLPEGVSIPKNLRETVWFDPELKRLIVAGTKHLTPDERDRLLELVEIPEDRSNENRAQWQMAQAYRDAVEKVFQRSSRLSFKERLRISLGPYDPERPRIVFENFEGTLGHDAPEDIGKYYRELVAAYEANRDRAEQTNLAFQREHLQREWQELQKLRTALVGPVKALDQEFKDEARKLLTASYVEEDKQREQRALGPMPKEWTQQRVIDMLTIGSLTVLGILLICGLASRPAAILGAGMLMSFYLVWPPWPGVPEVPGSTEHSYIVNKNFIEALALLALAALPTGQWFGLDRLVRMGWRRLRPAKRGVGGPKRNSTNQTREHGETQVATAKS